MAQRDYTTTPAADGGDDLFVLDKPMMNETGNPLVYPFGFQPTLHKYRMNTPGKLKMGSNIFVGAMADIFGGWVPDGWINDILDTCMEYPMHNYLFLTKNPERYIQYGVPTRLDNFWYGTSITCDADAGRLESLIIDAWTFISVEPLRGRISNGNISAACRIADWIIIGAETGRSKDKVVPEPGWVNEIVAEADLRGKPVFMKDSLIPVLGESNMRRDFPEQLMQHKISTKMEKKLFSTCALCKARMKKGEMVALLARFRRGEQPAQYGFMCKDCFRTFCRDYGLDAPQLSAPAEDPDPEKGNADGYVGNP